jgi:hypothetical protein
MSKRLKTLWSRYTEAKADVDASDAENRRASAKRLAEILKSTNRSALVAGLKDPALIPFDREQLENAIAVRLPRHRLRIPLTIATTLGLAARHVRYHWRGLALFALIATPVITATGVAWHNTGAFKASFSQAWTFDWHFPDGHVEAVSIPAEAGVVAIGRLRNGNISLRFWDPNAGYGRTDVPADWFFVNAHIWKGNHLDVR